MHVWIGEIPTKHADNDSKLRYNGSNDIDSECDIDRDTDNYNDDVIETGCDYDKDYTSIELSHIFKYLCTLMDFIFLGN